MELDLQTASSKGDTHNHPHTSTHLLPPPQITANTTAKMISLFTGLALPAIAGFVAFVVVPNPGLAGAPPSWLCVD